MADLFEEAERAAQGAVESLFPASWRRAVEVLTRPVPPTPRRMIPAAADLPAARLNELDHIVVVMLENRSFDHMLGYLSLPSGAGGKDRRDVDGLSGPTQNVNTCEGSSYPIHPLVRTQFDGEAEDPDHSGSSVDEQLAEHGNGFVKNFKRVSRARAATLGVQPPEPGLVMGYYTGTQLPVYDLLASEYCIVDRWFSSVPGATWPNRLYAVAGRAEGSRDDISVPLYSLPSFLRYLDQQKPEVPWRWYSFDPGTLRAIDPEYRLGGHDHFAYVDARTLSPLENAVGELTEEGPSLLDDVASGNLPAVSWIDPRFKDLRVLGPNSNDDHPPSDVLAGQDLILTIYNALSSAPTWPKTLLVITYDEHGGFYDHVEPPAGIDEEAGFQRLGLRVPAILVSPLLAKGFSSSARLGPNFHFDHTSIIKTILMRFCNTNGMIPALSARVAAAEHLGHLLSDAPARLDFPDTTAVTAEVIQWRQKWAAARFSNPVAAAGPPGRLTDFQTGFYETARLLRRAGLPAGHP